MINIGIQSASQIAETVNLLEAPPQTPFLLGRGLCPSSKPTTQPETFISRILDLALQDIHLLTLSMTYVITTGLSVWTVAL